MKTKVHQDVKSAVSGLQGDRNFKRVTLWIFQSLEDTRKENDTLVGINLTRSQGAAIVLDKILKTFENLED